MSAIKQRVDIPGFVYVLKAGMYYKIGRAKNLNNRIKKLKIQLPFAVTVIITFPCVNTPDIEGILHNKYASKRVNGEWFVIEEKDLEFIRKLGEIFTRIDVQGIFGEKKFGGTSTLASMPTGKVI